MTGWQEGEVQEAFTSGQTPFAIDYPFVFGAAAEAGSAVPPNEIGFAAFPPVDGSSQSPLGGEMLALNAKSHHAAAAWQFVQYLDNPQVQDQRAVSTGDPPALQASYNPTLFSQAPYFQQVDSLAKVTVDRPVTPDYPQISTYLQTMISSVLENLASPSSALSTASSQVKPLVDLSETWSRSRARSGLLTALRRLVGETFERDGFPQPCGEVAAPVIEGDPAPSRTEPAGIASTISVATFRISFARRSSFTSRPLAHCPTPRIRGRQPRLVAWSRLSPLQ